MNRVIAVIASSIVLAAFAQPKDAHKHGDEHKPKFGGIVKEVKESQYELVAKPDVITVFVEDHRQENRYQGRHLKSANMIERLNEELRRRTRVVRIFPNVASCLRLTRALCAETHEGWLDDSTTMVRSPRECAGPRTTASVSNWTPTMRQLGKESSASLRVFARTRETRPRQGKEKGVSQSTNPLF